MSGPKEIPVTELSIPQLNQLSQQLEQDVDVLQNSLSSLKHAQGRFSECKESLTKLTTDNLKKDILVPLTSSMYVAGQLADVETVLVDIGTGYYVQMKLKAATDYYQRKVDFLSKQMESLQPILQEKSLMKESVMEVMQMKVRSQLMAHQQTAATSKS